MSCSAWRRDSAALAKLSLSRLAATSLVVWSDEIAPPLELEPASAVTFGASGESWWMSVWVPSLLAPWSPSAVPARMPPAPLVEGETLAGAK